MRDGPVQKGLNSNDVSKGVLSEGEPSYMLSDGGTKRVKYADIVSVIMSDQPYWPLPFFRLPDSETSITIAAFITNKVRSKEVSCRRYQRIHLFTHRRNSWLRHHFIRLRHSAKWDNSGDHADHPGCLNLILHGHASRQSLQQDAVQQV